MKKRQVYLLGAGAAMDWYKAPSTASITNHVINSGFKNKEGEYVTKVIYDWLIGEDQWNKANVNFETIVNVLEDFVQYWSSSQKQRIFGLSFFIDERDEKWGRVINYELKSSHSHYEIRIPQAGEAFDSRCDFVGNQIHPTAKYFELLLMVVLDNIVSTVTEYSFCTINKQLVDCKENSEINELAISYFQQAVTNNILRIYSLNYDRLLQYVLYKADIPAFQGFNLKGHFPDVNEKPWVELKRILEDVDSNCIYHLHGNAWWEVDAHNANGLDAYNFFLEYGNGGYIFNSGFADIEMEKGKRLLISGIITGYQKAQRTALSPFRQMLSAFDRDCIVADEIIIIGYSFGDEHINDIIRNARKYNPKSKLVVIDPAFDDRQFVYGFTSHWGQVQQFIFENAGDKRVISEQYNLEIFKMGFKEYLSI